MKTKFKFLFFILLPFFAFSQNNVKGSVYDESGGKIAGATVIVKGTTNAVSTDSDGNFSINLKKNQNKIDVSFIGFTTQTFDVTNKEKVKVILKSNVEQLNDIVVIGYGSVKKKDLTGSIATIKPTQEIAEQSKGIEDVIKGRAAGVQVSANGSEPGASVSIKIRGTSSLTGNSEPLYVVDGIIMDSATEDTKNPLSGYAAPQGGGISGINPADIESIEILKDASATAIYGSRASNGVVIVTTKKGKKGNARFDFTTSTGVGTVVRNIEVLDTNGYANYQNEMKAVLGQTLPYTINTDGSIFTTGASPVQIKGINWAKDTYRNSIVKKNRLSISGGGESGDYFLAGGSTSNQGTFPNALAKSIDFNFNFNQNLSDKIKIGSKISTTYSELSSSKGTDENGGSNSSMLRQVLLAAPIVNLAANNQNATDVTEALDGPRAWASDYDDLAKEVRLLGALTMDYKLSKTFTFRLRFGGDYRAKERTFWYGTSLLRGKNVNGEAGISTLNRFRYNIDNTLMFNKSINKHNKINGTIGYLVDKTSIKNTGYSAANFADKSLRADGISYGTTNTPLIIQREFPTIISFIARANYDLNNKYLLTGTFRADGSSKFSKGNQWGYFPSLSFAWKAIEEPFLKNQETVSNLKFRLGYGEVGNQNIGSYSGLTTFVRTEAALSDASGGSLVAVIPPKLANPDLKWESAIQYNSGIDLGFFNDRLTANIDAYYKTSTDLLLDVAVGPTTGYNFITANRGNIENRGLEGSLNANIIKSKDLNWSVFGNISFNKNKIGSLGIAPAVFGNLGEIIAFTGTQISGGTFFKQPANIFIEGRESGLFYGLQTKGIIRTATDLTSTPTGAPLKYQDSYMRVGDVYFVDQNNDGNITDADKTIIGNPNPDYTFGLGSSFNIKNFSLSLMFNGVYGNDIANGNMLESGYANSTVGNVIAVAYNDAFNAVTNPNGTYPNVGVGGYGSNYTTQFNDRMVEDGSFLRLSYVTLGYNVPIKENKFFNSVKLSLSGQNLWLLTNYSGFDPEVNSFSYDPTRTGIDWGSFPNQRTFTLGLNVGF